MSYPINYPTPQGANVQIFKTPYSNGAGYQRWTKPQGVSFVWFTLIGGGAGGDGGSNGGGSGAVTNCMVPAFLIPDNLAVLVGTGGNPAGTANGTGTYISYIEKNSSGYDLLTAQGGISGGSGGAAMSANSFTAMGFFQSIAGQAGISGAVTASSTTFLSGGSGTNPTTANYGYVADTSGFFQMQPIIVGVGGTNNSSAPAGVGCGGGLVGKGGNGLVVIITW
jgi:hypothetical protein